MIGGDKASLGPVTVLAFTYFKSKGATAQLARLTCVENEDASATGYLKDDAAQACKDVAARSSLMLKGPDRTKACASIYGGPQTFNVSGRVDFETVDRTFKRTNGCQIAAWNEMAPLMPPGAPN